MEFLAQIGYFGDPNPRAALCTVCSDGASVWLALNTKKPEKED